METTPYIYITVDETRNDHEIHVLDSHYDQYSVFDIKAILGTGKHVNQRTLPTGQKVFVVSHTHLRRLVEAYSAKKMVYVEHISKTVSKCDKRCVEAEGPDCVCACVGLGHGSWEYSWTFLEVGDSTLIESLEYHIIRGHYQGQSLLWDSEAEKWIDADAEGLQMLYQQQAEAQKLANVAKSLGRELNV